MNSSLSSKNRGRESLSGTLPGLIFAGEEGRRVNMSQIRVFRMIALAEGGFISHLVIHCYADEVLHGDARGREGNGVHTRSIICALSLVCWPGFILHNDGLSVFHCTHCLRQ